VRGLDVGADDFLTKPVNDMRSSRACAADPTENGDGRIAHARAHVARDRAGHPEREAVEGGRNGRILIVDDRASSYERIAGMLQAEHAVEVEPEPAKARFRAAEGDYELIIVCSRACARRLRRSATPNACATMCAASRGKPVLVLDIDFFKASDDNHRHEADEDVLREFALRIRSDPQYRPGLPLWRRGFVILMPETDAGVAAIVGERLRRAIAGESFLVQQGMKLLNVTLPIGLATLNADQALYRAKHGRNRVVAGAA
jgi:diguanylate cyclase (GGDEF)-like protein